MKPRQTNPPGEPLEGLVVSAEEAGQRIDNVLFARLKGVPKTRLYRALRRGEVRVNKGRVKPLYHLQAGDRVRVPPLRLAAPKPAPPPLPPLAILHEDASLLIVNKPAGLPVHGGSGVGAGLIERLRVTPRAGADTPEYLQLAHRLDRATSGCLALAKSRAALLDLHAQLKQHSLSRAYLALVGGAVAKRRVVDLPLGARMQDGRKRIRVDGNGRAAQTRFEPVRRWPDWTLLRARLTTGRMHQVRVHAAGIGHPLAGDVLYGDRQVNENWRALGGNRLFLHADRLHLRHPDTGRGLEVHAPLPEDLEALLGQLPTG